MGFDLNGGGDDLIFPHHEMGAAEACCATGSRPQARHYLHVAMVGLDGEKMSKSRGNLVFVSQLRKAGTDPMAIRLALLAHHYRTAWEWTDADLRTAEQRLERWRAAAAVETPPTPGRSWPGCAAPSPTTWTRPPRWPRSTSGRTQP